MKNYYYILGVKNTASEEEIRTAYKKLTFLLHPDRNGGDAFFEERFKEIQEAYSTLNTPHKRQSYDLELADFVRPTGYNSINTTTPSIIQFEVSKKAIEEGEVVTLVWKAVHADTIHIDPIGIVEASGTKTIRLNGLVNKPRMHIMLTATNTFIQKSVQKQITILNKSFKGIENSKIETYKTAKIEDNYQKYDNYAQNDSEKQQLIVKESPKPKNKKAKKKVTLGVSKNNLISVLIVIFTVIVLVILGIVVYQLNMGK